jgi:hypothetical protein
MVITGLPFKNGEHAASALAEAIALAIYEKFKVEV